MTEDNFILLGYILLWSEFSFFFYSKRFNKKRTLINVGIHLIYTVFFFLNYIYTGPGGGILAVLLMWLLFLSIHLVLNLLIIIWSFIRRKDI